MAVAFASKQNFCSDYYNAVNLNTDVTCATYNVPNGCVVIRHYYNNKFDTKEAISGLNQLFYENKIGWVLPWTFSCASIANLAIIPL